MAELYLLESPSGKRYIGVTEDTAQARFSLHIRSARHRGDYPLARAIRKYGPEGFRVTTLLRADLSYCYDREQPAIESFKTMRPNGYNARDGGKGLGRLCPEAEEKRVKGLRGLKRTPEQRKAQSEAMKRRWAEGKYHGVPMRPESKEALSRSVKKAYEEGRAGYVRTPECNAKNAASVRRAYAEGRLKPRPRNDKGQFYA